MFALLSADVFIQSVITYMLIPFFLQRLFISALRKISPPLEGAQLGALAQRATRAVMAVSFLTAAYETLPIHNIFLDTSTAVQTVILNTILYYVFDCLNLVLQRDFNPTMWMHHVACICSFSIFAYSGYGQGGAMYILMSEGLVPFGFSLFFLKMTKKTGGIIFKLATLGGFCFILFRACLWTYLCLQLFTPLGNGLPLWFSGLTFSLGVCGYIMEAIWGRLYYKNVLRAFSGKTRD